jgi:hypothetical protein
MAHIVIITHAYDDFQDNDYLLRRFIPLWTGAGHRVSVAVGLGEWPDGDIAILHMDLSVIPSSYAEASKRYGVVVNGAALDIRKRVVSRYLVRPNDDWAGPVIVKTDLNCGGTPELRVLQKSRRAGVPVDHSIGEIAFLKLNQSYPILRSVKEVPDAVWNNPGLVVERFLPEQDARGFWLRAWVFLGDRERCTRYLGSQPVIKGGNILAREPAPVPDSLRAERERLGFETRPGWSCLGSPQRSSVAPGLATPICRPSITARP